MAQVEFNRPADGGMNAMAMTPADALYAALVQFVAIYPAVARDLESYLRPINGKSEAGTPDVLNAEYAVAALETVVDGVATAYKTWADAHAQAMLAGEAPPRVVYRFEIALEQGAADPPEAVVRIGPQSFEQDGTAVANFLPLAVVAIDPDNYKVTPIHFDPATGAARYSYALRPDARDPTLPAVMPYETARLNALRSVGFAPLDLFALQNGWASVQVMRNRHLAPSFDVTTNPAFEFATAEARFANPLVPLLDYASYPLDQGAGGQQPVNAWITAFFGSLLAPGAGVGFTEPVLVKLETSYSYQLVPGTLAVPATQIPISLLPPTSTAAGTTDPAFLSAVSAVAQNWFDTQHPVNDATAAFHFGLAAFSPPAAATCRCCGSGR